MNQPKRNNPFWETIVMAASFAMLWAWFWARHTASRTPGATMWPGWTVLQIIALAALVFVLVRRMIRVRDSMHESSKLPNQFPFMNRPMNGAPHNGTSQNNGHNGTNGTAQNRKRK